MRCIFQGPGVQVVALVPVAGPVPPPISVVRPPESAVPDKLRANKMNVRVDAAGGDDFSFAGDHFGARADDHSGRDAVHDVGIAGLADADDASAADSDVGFYDSPVVHDHRVGDHQIEGAACEVAEADCPMPSRSTLPPPNLASSPGVVRSRSISMSSSVSARRMRSPVVGP